ncbi:uncharacterized protein MONOS_10369 [Monocercomonoides exilis]|uniref:uncharacterized protein n=1 Tax=Monocercomonoides exilis TaxID=2049356 RepID=UPI0035599D63|nr:hypothetical protein MONOS_10369 [Monocercomonoides exilis]|eukprot:MONOS_10369.1-p1 / transcript=MONOS_10369.1 / gene=MONOS_10369 / organism=Monocercomonoides_exilis_PA203 / gene_product=unspecified product / transcript_product=unspecified product / location=Mono_scaffold00468:25696-28971(+) / protein_length=653 / sequence_SO=supercontig / SO=protein_coding / is_pseudo=false
MIDEDEVPFTQRRGETTLFTIQQAGKKRSALRSREFGSTILDIGDIQGTKPTPPLRFNRPPVDYDSYEGTHPKPLTINRSLPHDSSLDCSDIEGTHPKSLAFHTTRIVDPLQPRYLLPQVQPRPITPPPFLRDNISVNDIEGTKTRPVIQTGKPIREGILDVSDIAKQGFKERIKKQIRDPINCDDINDKKKMQRTPTDPLNPHYIIAPSKLEHTLPCFEAAPAERSFGGTPVEVVGDIDKSHPRVLHQKLREAPMFNLMTQDIPGASRNGAEDPKVRVYLPSRPSDGYLNTRDIEGAQSRTIKRRSLRVTNPVDPDYSSAVMTEATREIIRNEEMEHTNLIHQRLASRADTKASAGQKIDPVTWRPLPSEELTKPAEKVHPVTRGYEGHSLLLDMEKSSPFLSFIPDKVKGEIERVEEAEEEKEEMRATKRGRSYATTRGMSGKGRMEVLPAAGGVFGGVSGRRAVGSSQQMARSGVMEQREPVMEAGALEGQEMGEGVATRSFEGSPSSPSSVAAATSVALPSMRWAGESTVKAREMPIAPQMLSNEQKEQIKARDALQRMEKTQMQKQAMGGGSTRSSAGWAGRPDLSMSASGFSKRGTGLAARKPNGVLMPASTGRMGSSSGGGRMSQRQQREAEQLMEDIATIRALT